MFLINALYRRTEIVAIITLGIIPEQKAAPSLLSIILLGRFGGSLSRLILTSSAMDQSQQFQFDEYQEYNEDNPKYFEDILVEALNNSVQ